MVNLWILKPTQKFMELLGTPCVLFSKMGKKTGTSDPRFACHKEYYKKIKITHSAILIENVPEYGEEIIRSSLGKEWSVKALVIDPRVLGIPAARSRLYALAWRHSKVNWRPEVSLESIVEAMTAQVVADASIFHWRDIPQDYLTPAAVAFQKMKHEQFIHVGWLQPCST